MFFLGGGGGGGGGHSTLKMMKRKKNKNKTKPNLDLILLWLDTIDFRFKCWVLKSIIMIKDNLSNIHVKGNGLIK